MTERVNGISVSRRHWEGHENPRVIRIDILRLASVPILVGDGERFFARPGDGANGYECVGFVPSDAAVHARFARRC